MVEYEHGPADDRELRVGLVGYGVAGAVFHAPLIAATPGLRLATLVTASAARAQEARARYGSVQVVPAAEALWQHSDDLDLIVIASPNDTHVTLAEAALKAGLPVVVDKPLAAKADEGRRIFELAQSQGQLLTVFQNRRWDGDFLTVRQLLAKGALGEPLRFESRYERWRPQPKPGWRQHGGEAAAGGILYDLGSHLIDQALQLFGPARQVYAELERRYPQAKVDDDSFVALTHHSGVRSHLWMSSVASQLGPRFRVLGRAAAYTKYGLDPQESALRQGRTPAQPDWGCEPAEHWGMLGTPELAQAHPTVPGSYGDFYAEVRDALRGAGPVPVDPADAVAVLEVIHAAQRSAASGQTVALVAV